MTKLETEYMTLACEMSDAQGSSFIGTADEFLVLLGEKGITEEQVWECQLSLWRQGFIDLYANFKAVALSGDPTWSRSAPEFIVLPKGLQWWSRA
jgi:hypothetical protein